WWRSWFLRPLGQRVEVGPVAPWGLRPGGVGPSSAPRPDRVTAAVLGHRAPCPLAAEGRGLPATVGFTALPGLGVGGRQAPAGERGLIGRFTALANNAPSRAFSAAANRSLTLTRALWLVEH